MKLQNEKGKSDRRRERCDAMCVCVCEWVCVGLCGCEWVCRWLVGVHVCVCDVVGVKRNAVLCSLLKKNLKTAVEAAEVVREERERRRMYVSVIGCVMSKRVPSSLTDGINTAGEVVKQRREKQGEEEDNAA